jgi:hypothetical protein
MTGAVILFLYFRRGLSPHLYNTFDQAIIARLCSKKRMQHDVTADPLNLALRKFLFTLSDLQLASGVSLALVVYIRFAKADEFSTYSFQMATSTVFMSCLTHLSTLAALPDEFFNDPGTRPRLIVMGTLAFLLMPILIISSLPSFTKDAFLSFKCAREEFSSYSGLVNVYAALVAATITLMIIFGYYSRIRTVRKGPPYRSTLPRTLPGDRTQSPIQALRNSFLLELISLTFYYTFGMTNLIVRWTTLPPLKQWSLSFGQLLPGGLLLFTLLPVYADYLKGKLPMDTYNLISKLPCVVAASEQMKPSTPMRTPKDTSQRDLQRGNVMEIIVNDLSNPSEPRDTRDEHGDRNNHPDTIEFSLPSCSMFPGEKEKVEVRTSAFIGDSARVGFYAPYRRHS